MSANIRGEPERLEAYTENTHASLPPAREAVQAYAATVAAFNAAGPNGLGSSVDDLGPSLQAELDLLEALDAAPAAFAFALRHLDALAPSEDPWAWMVVGDLEWFEALVIARLELPHAGDDQVVDAALVGLDASWTWPWSKGFANWAEDRVTSPPWWATSSLGATTDSLNALDRSLLQRVSGYQRGATWVEAYPRWRAGSAQLMNRIVSARRFSRIAPWVRRVGWLGPPLAGVGQLLEDWGDPTLTTGDHIARTGAAVALDGGIGLAGASLGAAAGTLVLPGIGTVVGAVAGGLIGAEVGQNIRQNLDGIIDWGGGRIDTLLEWGGDGAGWAGDRLQDGWDWAGGHLSEGAGWVGDRLSDAGALGGSTVDWGAERLDDGAGWLGDRTDDAGDALGAAAGWLGDRL